MVVAGLGMFSCVYLYIPVGDCVYFFGGGVRLVIRMCVCAFFLEGSKLL